MSIQRLRLVTILANVCLLASVCTMAANGDKAELKGMITSRTGSTFIMKTDNGHPTVFITDDTVTKDDKGLFGLDKHQMSNVVLIPGLKVKVEGIYDAVGRVTAKTITVDGDDLETAEMIQAGLHPTIEQVNANMQAIETNRQGIEANRTNIEANRQNIEANRQQIEQNISDIEENTKRFSSLAEYDVKGEATVHFAVGSSKLSKTDEEELHKLAQSTVGLTGYLVEVIGYADSTGNAAINTRLSEDRAKAVVTYLMQQGRVPLRNIVAPGAMGEYGAAASNETKSGRAENRRVEVKVLVNKGIAGT
jgi:OOP family OmpA-OmpF porin